MSDDRSTLVDGASCQEVVDGASCQQPSHYNGLGFALMLPLIAALLIAAVWYSKRREKKRGDSSKTP